jgi:hypothetical protein
MRQEDETRDIDLLARESFFDSPSSFVCGSDTIKQHNTGVAGNKNGGFEAEAEVLSCFLGLAEQQAQFLKAFGALHNN